jgi:hypothetical protein
VKEVYELRKKEYIFKENQRGELANYTKLVDGVFGPAIKTFRKEQEVKSRFPLKFWE